MLPSGWQYIQVTATYRGSDDTAPSGSVHLYTDQVVSGEGVTVVPRSFVADIDSDGSISVELPSPNYPDLGFTGLYYRVVERFPGGREPFTIYVPHDSDTIDLATAVPMVTPPELVSALSASVVQVAAAQAAIATTQAGNASAAASTAATNATSAAASAGTATTQATTATSAATTATTQAGNAGTSAAAAASDAATATTKSANAGTSAANAATSAAAAGTSATAAAASASSASTDAGAASTSASNAAASADEAHTWATTAGALVSGVLHYMGAFDPSTGAFPASPTLGDFWKISGTGTIAGVDLSTGDQIIYNGATWDKIDNTEAVTSVAGRVGPVVVGIADLAGLQDALDAKLGATATAAAATKLATPRTINGVAFDGTGNIQIGQLDAVNALAISSGAVAIDCALGDAFTLTLTGNVTAVTFANLQAAGKSTFAILKIKQDATGGRTITWPSSVKWAGGTAYVPSAAANAVDTVGLMTLDAGTTWQGVASKAFA